MIAFADFIREVLLVIRSWFFKFIPKQSYLYMACGGLNLAFDMLLFFISYHFIFFAKNFVTPIFTFSPHIAAFLFAFIISTPTGFFMSRYVVWTNSSVRGRKQLISYIGVVTLCTILNIGFLKLLVEYFHFYPLPSKILTAIIVVFISYILQRYYTFKVHKITESI
jgi:putative flippase GtrA